MIDFPMTVHYLEIFSRENINRKLVVQTDLKITQVKEPDPAFAQWLYRTVGREWYWVDRYYWSFNEWEEWISDSCISLWTMELSGKPIGFYMLDPQDNNNVEVSYFGLLPGYLGSGLGGHLLTNALNDAFSMGASRIWLHTCSLDHPYALSNYEARGMSVYKVEDDLQHIPDGWPIPDDLT
ncbi:MAG TPA: GNAT family N-acetyltransferase [Dehalococcoidia bacterium]|jgi:ribosomal protein S18 acetylase RimI-like enzyme|nr:GNAT family N-acetyltransferase [Dehalococcoidia bacterium]